ncbi:Nuf2 family-domain-containing protein [Polychytrium aggregatum]|uniref:Nuf2 family-domain-containing protein n=1 Tax=Polychytrium aggregatum TaxID=110093 RepID=UPI0022FE677D|nr:Nuf2 family-domain-containing protein [Polychytrium aggregatum]KAI9202191.1 Nuf2 family-domain-containing protein [Polychytrium aggregatum]
MLAAANYQFIWPTLPQEELLECLSELKIQAQQRDLTEPTAVRAQAIYESFSFYLTGLNRDSFAQPNYETLEFLDYPDIHQESLPTIAFFKHLQKLMVSIGAVDFSYSDFVRPTAKRFVFLLSCLINFTRFRHSKIELFNRHEEEKMSLEEKRRVLAEKKAQLSERVNNIRLQRAAAEPAIQAKRQEISQLKSEVRELVKSESAASGEYEQVKREKAELNAALDDLTFKVDNVRQESMRLRPRIISNPQELKRSLLEMEQTVRDSMQKLDAQEKHFNDYQYRMEYIKSNKTEISDINKLKDEIESERKKYEEVCRSAADLQNQIEKRKTDERGLSIQKQQLDRALRNANEKLNRLHRNMDMKKESTESKLLKLREDYAQAQREVQAIQAKIDEHNKRDAAIQEKILEMETQLEDDYATLRANALSVKAQLELHYHAVVNATRIE